MFNLFRKKKKEPQFTLIKNFHKRDAYFVRTAEWGMLDEEEIFVKQHEGSKIITLSPWARHVFLSANGQTTVEAFTYLTAAQYSEGVPDFLERTLIFELHNLAASKFIAFVSEKQQPALPFQSPGLTV